jgi:hypothetical protein
VQGGSDLRDDHQRKGNDSGHYGSEIGGSSSGVGC